MIWLIRNSSCRFCVQGHFTFVFAWSLMKGLYFTFQTCWKYFLYCVSWRKGGGTPKNILAMNSPPQFTQNLGKALRLNIVTSEGICIFTLFITFANRLRKEVSELLVSTSETLFFCLLKSHHVKPSLMCWWFYCFLPLIQQFLTLYPL